MNQQSNNQQANQNKQQKNVNFNKNKQDQKNQQNKQKNQNHNQSIAVINLNNNSTRQIKQINQQNQSQSKYNSITIKKIILVIFLIIFFVFIIIAIIIHFLFLIPKDYQCNLGQLCQGVNQDIINFIFWNYQNSDARQSLLQVAQTLNIIDVNNQTQANSIQAFQKTFRSLECSNYILGDQYILAYNGILSLASFTQERLMAQFTMLEHYSTHNIKSSNFPQDSCKFQINQPNRTRYLSSTNEQNKTKDQRLLLSNQQCHFSQQKTVLIYFDGLQSFPQRRLQNLKQLKNLIKTDQQLYFDGYDYQSSYRLPQNFYTSLLTAVVQKLNQQGYRLSILDVSIIMAQLLHYKVGSFLNFLGFDNTNTQINLQVPLYAARTLIEKEVMKITQNLSQNNLINHKTLLRSYLNRGIKIVLVAHSQGAMYANSVYNNLSQTERKSISLAYIAPAASNLADNSVNYITNPQDDIINYIRDARKVFFQSFPEPLPANLSSKKFDIKKCYDHCLSGYVKYYPQQIKNLILNAKNKLISPTAIIKQGAITITLNWDNQPDVDLHVFQPTGSHVYYSYRNGISGSLDRDDTNGIGPEHYYSTCQTLVYGIYSIRVNYFAGYGASNVNVILQAGQQTKEKNFTVYPPLGSNGNNNPPYKIANIQVFKNINNKTDFKIIMLM